jgi:hypothetical protein
MVVVGLNCNSLLLVEFTTFIFFPIASKTKQIIQVHTLMKDGRDED